MRNFHLKKNMYFCPTINLDRLWELVPKDLDLEEGKAPVLDLPKAGYFKVLGLGTLPKRPIIVKARYFSQAAERKIKDAGGVCVLTG